MDGYLGTPARESGFAVLEQLAKDGWSVSIIADGRGGVQICATRGWRTLTRQGDSVADVALLVYDASRRGTS